MIRNRSFKLAGVALGMAVVAACSAEDRKSTTATGGSGGAAGSAASGGTPAGGAGGTSATGGAPNGGGGTPSGGAGGSPGGGGAPSGGTGGSGATGGGSGGAACTPPAPGGECDTFPQCGCPGKNCSVDTNTGLAKCIAIGTIGPYQPCSNQVDCQAGYVCALGQCKAFCETKADCTATNGECVQVKLLSSGSVAPGIFRCTEKCRLEDAASVNFLFQLLLHVQWHIDLGK